MKRKRSLFARSLEYAGLFKVIPFASEGLRLRALSHAWLDGYRKAKQDVLRAKREGG